MTQYLGIITAYGAVAVLAWLVYLLYPRLIPAAARYTVEDRWPQVGRFALAVAFAIIISRWQQQGWLFADDNGLFAALNRVVILAPVLVYIASRRNRAAVLIPSKQILRSLVIGLAFGALGLAAYFLSGNMGGDLPAHWQALNLAAAIEVLVRTLLHCLVVAAFLALVNGGWSKTTALVIAALAIAATQIPGLLENGFSVGWLGLFLTHILLVVGLLSATLATRNIVWLWPVLAVLNLLQLSVG